MTDAMQIAKDNLVFECVAGSKSYGTDHADSDTDIRGVFIAPPKHILGAFDRIEMAEDKVKDITYYELDKFVKLASGCNPNTIELLFTDTANVLQCSPEFHLMRLKANLFLSCRARHKFSGYAMSQLKRILGHSNWIKNPAPQDPPTLHQFSMYIREDGASFKPDPLAWESLQEGSFLIHTYKADVFTIWHDDNLARLFVSEDGDNINYYEFNPLMNYRKAEFKGTLIFDIKKFKEAKKRWRQYWGWRKNRNPARAALEEKWGFDTKHAMHLVRLMRMAQEILIEQKVLVRRPDAEELKQILAGKFDIDTLVKWAQDADANLENLEAQSSLPRSPDVEAINDLVMTVRQQYWRRKRFV